MLKNLARNTSPRVSSRHFRNNNYWLRLHVFAAQRHVHALPHKLFLIVKSFLEAIAKMDGEGKESHTKNMRG